MCYIRASFAKIYHLPIFNIDILQHNSLFQTKASFASLYFLSLSMHVENYRNAANYESNMVIKMALVCIYPYFLLYILLLKIQYIYIYIYITKVFIFFCISRNIFSNTNNTSMFFRHN